MRNPAFVLGTVSALIALAAAGCTSEASRPPGIAPTGPEALRATAYPCPGQPGAVSTARLVAYRQQQPDWSWGSTPEAAVQAILQTVRCQLESYRAEHGDVYPVDFASQMTLYTDAEGAAGPTCSEQFHLGPYLWQVPANPYTGSRCVTIVRSPDAVYEPAAETGRGWWYNSATGEFRCHVPGTVRMAEGGKPVNRL